MVKNKCYVFLWFTVCIQGGPKTGPLCSTVHVFEMLEPVCVIFGILEHCVVLNTSVKYTSILNKFLK